MKAITTIALLAFAAVAIAFGIRAGQERLTYRVRFSGDWSHSAIVFYGLLLSFSSFLFFAMGPKKETLGETVLLVSFLAAGLVMALSGLRHGYGGVRGKADLQGQSSRGMQITTSILIILGALAAILLVIIVGRALTG